jgi:putative tryptophan/tyrosine transport system substrate-binding protein
VAARGARAAGRQGLAHRSALRENLSEFFRRAASFVDKVFKGAKPGDLPMEQPTRFNLVINRKTADALGVAIPPQLYIFADEVIE